MMPNHVVVLIVRNETSTSAIVNANSPIERGLAQARRPAVSLKVNRRSWGSSRGVR